MSFELLVSKLQDAIIDPIGYKECGEARRQCINHWVTDFNIDVRPKGIHACIKHIIPKYVTTNEQAVIVFTLLSKLFQLCVVYPKRSLDRMRRQSGLPKTIQRELRLNPDLELPLRENPVGPSTNETTKVTKPRKRKIMEMDTYSYLTCENGKQHEFKCLPASSINDEEHHRGRFNTVLEFLTTNNIKINKKHLVQCGIHSNHTSPFLSNYRHDENKKCN